MSLKRSEQLFAGVTTSPAREFIGELWKKSDCQTAILPCVGKFGALSALLAGSNNKSAIHASDLALFSSVIGYLSDPNKTINDLPIRTDVDEMKPFLFGEKEADIGASILLTSKFTMVKATNMYSDNLRQELMHGREHYHAELKQQIERIVGEISGINYEIEDVRDVIEKFCDANLNSEFMFVNLPGYAGGYAKQYGSAEDVFGWDDLVKREFDPSESPAYLEKLHGCNGVVVTYISTQNGTGVLEQLLDVGYTQVMARVVKDDRTDYLLCNRDIGDRLVSTKVDVKEPRKFPIFTDEHEITSESVVQIVPVDYPTVNYYRDLFVHRLSVTMSMAYYVLLIDGRVTTAFGLFTRDFDLGKTDYIYETFGITITSDRYGRLGKLFMLLLTTDEFKEFLMRSRRNMGIREPKGITTSSPTLHHEGKTDRGVMKLVKRDRKLDGTFHLMYQGDFRQEGFSDAIKTWLNKFGHKHRPGYECEECNNG